MDESRTQSLLVPPSQSGGWTEPQVLHKISFTIQKNNMQFNLTKLAMCNIITSKLSAVYV